MPTITLNQEKLFYALHQDKRATHNVVLLHGAGGNHLVWPAALRRLPRANVYALDLSGHGRSTGKGHANIAAYVQEVVQFIQALSLSNVVLIGHSMGGAVAQTIAIQQPPEATALVLIGTGAKLRVAPTILDQIVPNFEQAVSAINQFAWSAAAPPEMVENGRELLMQTGPTVMHADFCACDQFDIRDQLALINVPVLIISGSADNLTPPKYGCFLADHIPKAQFVQLDGAGHMMMLEKPGETTEAIQAFLKAESRNQKAEE